MPGRPAWPTPGNSTAPSYYAVVFNSIRTDTDDGHGATATEVLELAGQQPGCLGFESARDWYESFRVRICRVEREYGF